MRKALVSFTASLAVCGAATAALIATNARAEQSGHRPTMIALVTPQAETAQRPETAHPPDMRGMADPRRENICKEIYARQAGELAFLEVKLSLNTKQVPLFARWKQTSLDLAKQHESDCAQSRRLRTRDQRFNMMDLLATEEGMLKKRLADIGMERPALTALYNSLSPAQKDEFGRGGMRPMRLMMDRPGPMRMMAGPMGALPEPPPP